MNEARANRRIELILFLVSFLSFAFFYQASDHSTAARFDLVRSILERRTLWIDGYAAFNTADIINFNSHIYSVKAPGGSFTAMVPWIGASEVLKFWKPSSEAMYWALLTHLTIVFSTSLLVALLTVLMYRFALFLDASPGRAAATAVTLAFATIMFPYATEMTGEPIAAACAFAAFYILATSGIRGSAGESLLAGFLAGWAVLNDYPAMLIAVPLAIYAMVKLRHLTWIASFALGAGSVAALCLAYNRAAFGHPFFISYEAYKLPANQAFREQAVGFVGLTYPRLSILWKTLVDPQRGLWFCNPVLMLIVPGLAYWWRRRAYRAEFTVAAFAAVSFILFNASYGESIVSWGGGTATGPRQIVAAIPFMVLALSFLPKGANYFFGTLAIVSVFLMLMATAVEPHLPYEYANPLRDFTMPAYFRGDLAYNKLSYFGGPPVAGDSVAFNLGKLLRLRPAFQLWPLAGLWMVAAVMLMRALRPRSNRLARLGTGAALTAIGMLFVPPTVGALLPPSGSGVSNGLLGRYYEGMQPSGFPPHITRIDRQIDFKNITELGALPYPSFVIWTGKIVVPVTGLYAFGIRVDDAGWLKIDGIAVIKDPGGTETKQQEKGEIYLSSGIHRIEVGERNVVGDAWIRLFWRPPNAQPELVHSEVLIPDPIDTH